MKRLFSFILVMVMLLSVGTEVFAASTGWKDLTVKDRVRYENGNINLKELGINIDEIIGFDILKGNKRDKVHYSVDKDKVNFDSILSIDTDYRLRVITENDKINVNFKTEDLPNIKATGEEIIVKVPAMPEKGFNWPYYLRIPTDKFKNELKNNDSKRYLLVDIANSGPNGIEGAEKYVKDNMREETFNGILSELLYMPYIMPVIPRTNIQYESKDGVNQIYEHALDRDTMFLEKLVKENPEIAEKYKERGYEVKDLYNLDKQVLAMIDHAIEYLNKYNHKMEKDKFILNGFSASAEFANRLTFLHPNRVKIMVSGGAMEGVIMPKETYKGEDLIYPIGTKDYKELTGREFSLEEQNKVAKIYYTGDEDTKDTLIYNDCYGNTEKNIITKLWGKDTFKRRLNTVASYKENGGKGIFIHEKGLDHSYSGDMIDYVLEFILQNRTSDSPVYVTPTSSIHKYEIIK